MKKYFSNIRTLAALLMAGAAFAACSSDDNNIEQPANPTAPKTYTLTVNATKDASAATRALNLDGAKLVASWAEGDELSVFKAENRTGCTAGNLLGTISPVAGSISADGAKATFTGTLTGTVSNDDKLMLVYHPAAFSVDAFASQTGTLASASALDCATALVTASVSGSDITISETSATFTTHTAMLKLTLTTDGTTTINPTSLKMSMSAGPLTLKKFSFAPTAATYTANGNGVLYFALPSAADVAAGLSTTTDALSVVTITYAATVSPDTYTATKTGYTFAAGKYYAGTLTMTMALPAALAITSPAVGQVIGDDGKNYDYASLPGGVTAVAKICYVSGSNGLALALADEGQMDWSTAISTCAAHTPAFTGGTWKLATQDEWNNMKSGAGDYTALRDGFTSVGGSNLQSGNYWSSTEYNSGSARYYIVDSGGWYVYSKGGNRLVRACLAF